MAVIYIVSALVIVIFNFDLVPGAFGIIIDHAFNGTAATGGFAGATVLMAIRFGIARGVFSNEAGLGSAPIAHAAASQYPSKTREQLHRLEPSLIQL